MYSIWLYCVFQAKEVRDSTTLRDLRLPTSVLNNAEYTRYVCITRNTFNVSIKKKELVYTLITIGMYSYYGNYKRLP